ncbi:MAG: HRDC domain-containing protein [Anaerolineales bacterium]|nr:HRDC domain-containing protein [Anaerolineales bacterium]
MTKSALSVEPYLIQDNTRLNELVDHLLEQTVIGVDTESNSLYAYQERVCLIQFSTPQEDVVIDPLAALDLSRLAEVFRNPQIRKVFHAAEYDLICLQRDFGFEFQNLFDTMIAARILGRQQVGLGALLEREFGVHLDKRFQRANWGQRPIPPDLLSYAQEDTHYLIPLAQRLEVELKQKGLATLAQEDFQRLVTYNGKIKDKTGRNDCWQIEGAYDLPSEKTPVLQELCELRDQIARRLDRPLFKVISDQKLIEIALSSPTDLTQLKRLDCLSKHQLERHGEAIIQAVRRGLRRPPLYPPCNYRPSDHYLARLEALRNWRKTTAQQLGVPSDVILPREVMLRLVDLAPRTKAELQQAMWDVPYRFEHFGEQILSLLHP